MTSLKLVYNSRETAGVMGLAKEVGAKLDGSEKDIPVIPLYVCELLRHIAQTRPAHEASGPQHPIGEIALTLAWAFRANISDRETLIKQADEFGDMIRRVDDDNGWPSSHWLNAIKGCCLAIEFGLADPERVRWPAEAGNTVAALVHGYGYSETTTSALRRSWVCARLLSARKEALKISDATERAR